MNLLTALAPELVLIAVACVLFFFGTSHKPSMRRLSALVALLTLVAVFVWQGAAFLNAGSEILVDEFNVVHVGSFALLVKTLVAGVGAVLVLLAWPGNSDATGSGSLNVGSDVGEFFGLTLLALAGVFMVGSANDMILLFLAIELAAIPTYIMVSISRPLPVAQEAGLKYFFLGAMAAAVMLFGFSYLYGGTGHIKLDAIAGTIEAMRNGNSWAVPPINAFLLMGLIVLLSGFAFKIAAVPFHAYVGDVYQGAATPVTALLAFVPKTSGFLAIIKILSAIGGTNYALPGVIGTVLGVVAVLTMTFGNVLGLLQLSVKRVLAYSSIAHSGYMLVAITALVVAGEKLGAGDAASRVQQSAIQGVLFYLAAYGLMNGGAFGILMLLPTRAHKQLSDDEPAPAATTAETFEDLAGQGRKHPLLGLGMAICCFSLIGLPLTIGFFGKIYLIKPALDAKLYWLVVLTMINAAISAAYYLKIVSTMFIRPLPADEADLAASAPVGRSLPLSIGVGVSVVATLLLGVALPWVDNLTSRIGTAAGTAGVTPAPAQVVEVPAAGPAPAVASPVSSTAQ